LKRSLTISVKWLSALSAKWLCKFFDTSFTEEIFSQQITRWLRPAQPTFALSEVEGQWQRVNLLWKLLDI
jgi:hypothetical protein